MTHLRIHKLALLTLFAALPLIAQTERPEVVFNVQIVQANPAARNALAGARERQAADFHRDDQMSIHVLTDQTDAPGLISTQRGRNALDIVSLPKMTTTAGLDAHFVIGGRYPVPTVNAASGNNRGNGNNGNAMETGTATETGTGMATTPTTSPTPTPARPSSASASPCAPCHSPTDSSASR